MFTLKNTNVDIYAGVEYCLDEEKMYNYGRRTINNCNVLNTELENLADAINNFVKHKNVKGKTGDAIHSYLKEVHLTLLAGIQEACAQYIANVEMYEYLASDIDSNKKAKLPSGELQFCQADIKLEWSKMKSEINDFNQKLGEITGLMSGLKKIDSSASAANVDNITKYINDTRNRIEAMDYEFYTSILVPLEDMISSTNGLVKQYKNCKRPGIKEPGTPQERITCYQSDDITKMAGADEFKKSYNKCLKFQKDFADEIEVANQNHIDYLVENHDEAEARKMEGVEKIFAATGGTILIVGGTALTVSTCGLASPVGVNMMITGSGMMVVNEAANIYEGYQDYQFGKEGDTTTSSFHFIRDGVCKGNKTVYTAYNVASMALCIAGGAKSVLDKKYLNELSKIKVSEEYATEFEYKTQKLVDLYYNKYGGKIPENKQKELVEKLKKLADKSEFTGDTLVPERSDFISGVTINKEGDYYYLRYNWDSQGTVESTREMRVLKVGDRFDRLGASTGKCTGVVDADGTIARIDQRSIPYYFKGNDAALEDSYHSYEVLQEFTRKNLKNAVKNNITDNTERRKLLKALKNYYLDMDKYGYEGWNGVGMGEIAPMFGKTGGGFQYDMPFSMETLKEIGMIKEIK